MTIKESIFSKKQSVITYTAMELIDLFQEGKIVTRDRKQSHVKQLKKYIWTNIKKESVYFPPLVATRETMSLNEHNDSKLIIVDGTQRLLALTQLDTLMVKAMESDREEEIVKGYKLQKMLRETSFAIQMIEGLTKKEQDQLYIDLNTKGKEVALSKRISYDTRNYINTITNELIFKFNSLQIAGVEIEKRAIIRPSNTNLLSLTQLRQLVGIFLTGKIVQNQKDINQNLFLNKEQYTDLMIEWFTYLFSIVPAQVIGQVQLSIFTNFPLLTSVCLYANENMIHKNYSDRLKVMGRRMEKLTQMDWSRNNKVWESFPGEYRGKEPYYYFYSDKTTILKLLQWLKSKEVVKV